MNWWLVAGIVGCVVVGLALDEEVDDHPEALEDRPILRKIVYVAAIPLIYAAVILLMLPFVALWETFIATPTDWLLSALLWPVNAAMSVMPESVQTLVDWVWTGFALLVFGWFGYLALRLLWQMYGPGPNPWEAEYPPDREY